MAGGMAVEATINQVTRYLDLAGVFACAILGGAVARTERLDLFGFLVVGVVSGLGGGVIRDTLLQHGTPVALTDYAYLPTALAGALLSFVISISESAWDRLFTALDAAVIGFWAIAGAQKTLAVGLGWLPAILLGTTTAVGGGALRDVLLRRVPAVFGGNGLYATVAAAVAATMVICTALGAPLAGIVVGVVGALLFRVAAVKFGWNLPSGLDWQPQSRLAAAWRKHRRRRNPREEEGD
ncbi:trimeric intracellular cation channel family protein [Amycolatopsis rhizosphaerae]|uniref:Trimeric intracellular cation channel family protein n=1 Tax=Amycolatopsis rhizosphaerae TaxID=2053003 RepID=A0A558BLW8_9PSEU|nr:TRIC cation channel family protein [Amycolatopsis rhizosphaerae]TVT37483.1 trimeric intracellular cation channel family protein [Amycolatopsis rhizosphaerae]